MVDEAAILEAVAEHPGVCESLYWGSRLARVVVALPDAPAGLVHDLVTDAWLRKAPKALTRDFGETS